MKTIVKKTENQHSRNLSTLKTKHAVYSYDSSQLDVEEIYTSNN